MLLIAARFIAVRRGIQSESDRMMSQESTIKTEIQFNKYN
jgi:hypothetical protein